MPAAAAPCHRVRSRTILAVSLFFVLVYAVVLVRIYVVLEHTEQSILNGLKTKHEPQEKVNSTWKWLFGEKKKVALRVSLPNVQIVQKQKVHEKSSFAAPSAQYEVEPADLWEDGGEENGNKPIPVWMKNYFRWHKETRAQINLFVDQLTEESTARYLILTCRATSNKCGGTADRLSAIPFLLRLAAQSRRLLLIHWGRPAPLEEFLLPPVNGMDWRVPTVDADNESSNASTFSQFLSRVGAPSFASTEDDLVPLVQDVSVPVVTCRFQSHDHGASFYNAQLKDSRELYFSNVTQHVWRVLFTPSRPVASCIVQTLNKLKLQPKGYVAAHLRALYAASDRDPALVNFWTRNAVNCSSRLLTDENDNAQSQQPSRLRRNETWPIFFAADNLAASLLATQYGDEAGVRVVTASTDMKEPLHLDKATHWKRRPPSDYYSAFVDLYLLAMSRCVAYGMGGYGKFASWLASCGMQHHAALGVVSCTLAREGSHSAGNNDEVTVPVDPSIFLPPMPKGAAGRRHLRGDEPNVDVQHFSSDLSPQQQALPGWMRSYFEWHQQQRQLLHRDNWRNFRYLIMTCTQSAKHCGGTADRLRSIPFMVRLAADTQRLLFIYWETPAPLESFLLPPANGLLDWRSPLWLAKELATLVANGTFYTSVTRLVLAAKDPQQMMVPARLQAHDHGSNYFNAAAAKDGDGEADVAFRQVYHDCWYSLFTPVAAIARQVEAELERLHLHRGNFAFAHLRALYGIEQSPHGREAALIRNWTLNSLNCLSHLRPGGPFFFSSDSAEARRIAVAYGTEKGVPIKARVDAPPPIHLDLDSHRHASAYNNVFVDLYLMSMGRCMTYNVGGFAKWAQLISGENLTCNIRHWTKGVDQKSANKSGCVWMNHEEAPSSSVVSEPNFNQRRPMFLPPRQP